MKGNEGKGATKLSEETVQLFSNVVGTKQVLFFSSPPKDAVIIQER